MRMGALVRAGCGGGAVTETALEQSTQGRTTHESMPSVAVTILVALHALAFVIVFAISLFFCVTGKVPQWLDSTQKAVEVDKDAIGVAVPRFSSAARRDRFRGDNIEVQQ
eukprot:Sspe_Gene.54498::Locus_30074_Transcript_2_3_Confidence_0.250_Length_1454::g.54498::m.54498